MLTFVRKPTWSSSAAAPMGGRSSWMGWKKCAGGLSLNSEDAGITALLKNGGKLEVAHQMPAHTRVNTGANNARNNEEHSIGSARLHKH
jgi:hypothetical protein